MKTPLVQIRDIAGTIGGVAFTRHEVSRQPRPGYLPVLRGSNVTEAGLNFDDLLFVQPERFAEKQLLRRHDVVVVTSSGSRHMVGKAAPVRTDFRGGVGIFCIVMRPQSNVHPGYLGHYFRTPTYRQFIASTATGTGIFNISNEQLNELTIPLLPFVEQQKIALVLDQAEALCVHRRKAIQLLDELVPAIFHQRFGDPLRNPKRFERVPIGSVTSHIRRGGMPMKGAAAYQTTGVPFIRSQNVHDGKLSHKNLVFIGRHQDAKLTSAKVLEGDVLLNLTGVSVARVCRAPNDILPAYANLHVLILRPNHLVESRYLEQVLLHASIKKELLRLAIAGAPRQALDKAQVAQLEIPLPPRNLQSEFAQRAMEVEQLKSAHQVALAASNELFSTLQHRAFNGEL